MKTGNKTKVKGEHVSVYKDRLMIMKWKNKNNIYLVLLMMTKCFQLVFKGKIWRSPK
jgi:hypothetical protein